MHKAAKDQSKVGEEHEKDWLGTRSGSHQVTQGGLHGFPGAVSAALHQQPCPIVVG